MMNSLKSTLAHGLVIPAHPLALDAKRCLDEQRQRALSRYYLAAGVGGLAVGVHTTQFAIHRADVGLYRTVLELAADELRQHRDRNLVGVAGVLGNTDQATREAVLAAELGYDCVLLSLAGLGEWSTDRLIEHCQKVAEVLPVFGFYLQPDVGGIELPYTFWRKFCELDRVVAIKVAAFNRYRTLDVVRATVEAEREDIALYTGNDDNILLDLLTPFEFTWRKQVVRRWFVGGLLGHWAFWTHRAVDMFKRCRRARAAGHIPLELLTLAAQVTDSNSAIFDSANHFRGCLPGIHQALRRQGLLAGTWCLDPAEELSPGQLAEIDRVVRDYPHLVEVSA